MLRPVSEVPRSMSRSLCSCLSQQLEHGQVVVPRGLVQGCEPIVVLSGVTSRNPPPPPPSPLLLLFTQYLDPVSSPSFKEELDKLVVPLLGYLHSPPLQRASDRPWWRPSAAQSSRPRPAGRCLLLEAVETGRGRGGEALFSTRYLATSTLPANAEQCRGHLEDRRGMGGKFTNMAGND
eukprot:767252-Hanusia_phi.AAC.1